MTMLAMHPLVAGLLPEIILAVGASLILVIGLATARSASRSDSSMWLALATVIAAFLAAWRLPIAGQPTGELILDPMVMYARHLSLALAVLILLANRHVPVPGERGEFFALMLFSIAGISLVANANNLIFLFLALELVSIPTYILIGLSRRNMAAQEATGKYFFLGAFAAALTLYGFSFLYGAAGTMRLFDLHSAGGSLFATLSRSDALSDPLVLLGLLLSLAGLGFKIAAVPLHFYVADVYQGAAAPVAGMLGFVPKFAGFLALMRLLSLSGWAYSDALFWLLWVLAAATMFVGNTLALMQQNVKRILAYSSIAHSGYMLVALTAGPGAGSADGAPLRNGLTALLFYVAVYGVMNLGAFAALAYFRKPGADEEDSVEMLDDLAGSARRHPWASLALAICVLGLMGFPLTGGFLAKVYIFSAGLSANEATAGHTPMIVLVVLGAVNSAIGAAYYLRILAYCYLRKPTEGLAPSRCGTLRLSLALCAVIVLLVFFTPGSLFDKSRLAVTGLPSASHGLASIAAQ